MAIKSRKKRKTLRDALRVSHGDRCIWCGEVMQFPKNNETIDLPNMATIEHYRAKNKGKGDNLLFLDLAHSKCNK